MILLASLRKELVACWEKGLLGLAPVSLLNNMSLLKGKMARIKPQILLLDYELPGLDGEKGIAELASLSAETKIIVYGADFSEEVEWAIYKVGAKGCCNDDMDPEQIRHIIGAVERGELWIRRALTHNLLHELVEITKEKNRIEQAAGELLRNLTHREYEIAILIGQGENNKRIARKLAITERTVKAHLTEIFRKLEISDRLNLALLIKETTTLPGHMQTHTDPRQLH